jgi:glycosyltransferase involved in cell wall biosynthesis
MHSLSLIIPIYNEAGHLQRFLQRVDAFDPGLLTELVLVDDCSRDGSTEILTAFPFTKPHRIISKTSNGGKGAALHTGIAAASGSIIGVLDADFEYDLDDIPRLVAPIVADKADVVYGSRFKQGNPQVHRTFHYLINLFLTTISNACSGLYLTDMETCYKFFRADILKNIVLESERFGFEPEITAKIARLQIRMQEIAISYYPRNYLQGKKISWKDGFAAIYHIVYYNLLQRRRADLYRGLPQHYIGDGRRWL